MTCQGLSFNSVDVSFLPILNICRSLFFVSTSSSPFNLYFLVFCFYWHFYFILCARLYASVDILLTCVRHLHDRIISLRVEVCAHKANLTPPRFIEVPVRKKWAVMYLRVRYNTFSVIYDFSIRFWHFRQCGICVDHFISI